MDLGRTLRFLDRALPARPDVVVVLGSGLGAADLGRESLRIPFRKIPGFPAPSVAGHEGALGVVGRTVLLRGRSHFYEGRSMEEVTRPVRALARLGARTLVLTNAAGGIAPRLRPGDLMAVTDHLNLMGSNPLRGSSDFVDLSEVYDPGLIDRAARAARRAGVSLRRGVYAAVSGPSYETPAEVRMLRRLGADAVGMSTVPEAVAGKAEGMRVLALSLITNRAAGPGEGPVSHREVLAAGREGAGRAAAILREFVK
jgi:purine-nucleoside phosphorylase